MYLSNEPSNEPLINTSNESLIELSIKSSNKKKKGPLGTSVQVRLTAQDIVFGPGKAMLLEYIEATGSIQEACARMELSYSKGSRMIKKAEKQLGFRLLERRIGGSGGGGSRLTPEAKDLLKKYQALVQCVREDADKAFREIFLS